MAGDKEQYNRALHKWDNLRAHNEYSVSARTGMIAILCSGVSIKPGQKARKREARLLEQEAWQLQSYAAQLDRRSFVVPRVNQDDFYDVLRDRDVATIIMIGNGALYGFMIEREKWLTWRDVSRESTHLKTGSFIQRFCGAMNNDLNVPFGTFAVDDQSKVKAAAGSGLPPLMTPKHEALLRPVHGEERLDYHRVKTLFPKVTKNNVQR